MKQLMLLFVILLIPVTALAEPGLPTVSVSTDPSGGQTYTLSIQALAMMTAFAFLPAALLMMTSFARIIIVLSILRQALGTMQTPTTQILIALALFLTFFIMEPVFDKVYQDGIAPYLENEIGPKDAFEKSREPMREFMMAQTRDTDINMFANISGRTDIKSPEDVPFSLLMPAFITSELKTAFQIGFLIFIPFLIIDLVVASVLMAMGMMMLSPMIISLPFKIMLFVLVDGWALIMGTLAASFYT